MISVSIITVTYHTGEVLWECLYSALAQAGLHELVVVNNGNPEGAEEKLLHMTQGDRRVRLITGHGNVGFAKACNMGARMASGDYVLFLNPDCVLSEGTLQKAVEEFGKIGTETASRPFNLEPRFIAEDSSPEREAKKIILLGARIIGADGLEQSGSRRAVLTIWNLLIEVSKLWKLGGWFAERRFKKHQESLPVETCEMPAVSGAFMLMRRDKFLEISGFDEGYFLHFEDLELCRRVWKLGGKVAFAPGIEVKHIGGSSGVGSWFIRKAKLRGLVRYLTTD